MMRVDISRAIGRTRRPGVSTGMKNLRDWSPKVSPGGAATDAARSCRVDRAPSGARPAVLTTGPLGILPSNVGESIHELHFICQGFGVVSRRRQTTGGQRDAASSRETARRPSAARRARRLPVHWLAELAAGALAGLAYVAISKTKADTATATASDSARA
jgi:hypothetical protein